MKEQLLLLAELQQIDSKIAKLEAAMSALPARLAPAKQDLSRLEAMLHQEESRLADAEKWRREQQDLIQRDEEDVQKAKQKLQVSKNNREFAAASREMDHKRRSISEREEEISKLSLKISAAQESTASYSRDIAELRAKVEKEEHTLLAQVETFQSSATTAAKTRDEIVDKLDAGVKKKYDRIRRSKSVAVVQVASGVCQGCHMTLPPQLNNVLASFRSIELCPNCRRIVFRCELICDPDEEDDHPKNKACQAAAT